MDSFFHKKLIVFIKFLLNHSFPIENEKTEQENLLFGSLGSFFWEYNIKCCSLIRFAFNKDFSIMTFNYFKAYH